MTKKIKLVTVVGTRPEVIRLSRTINFLDKNIDHVLVHTGQNYNYELNQIFFKDLNLKKPKYNINWFDRWNWWCNFREIVFIKCNHHSNRH